MRLKMASTPCPANDRMGEARWRDTPLKVGQAGLARDT